MSWRLFAFSRIFWLSAALLLPVGFCMMLQMSSSNTLIQAMSPDHLRGRVMAVYSMMFMGMAPFGAFFGGALGGPPGRAAHGGHGRDRGHRGRDLVLPVLAEDPRGGAAVDHRADSGGRRTGCRR